MKSKHKRSLIREYYGCFIYRQTEPGYKLPWYTIAPSLAADTLDGIKELVRNHVKGAKCRRT